MHVVRALDSVKKRVKKARKGPKLTAGRRPGGKVWLLLVPVAVVGGYVASRYFRNSEVTETSDTTLDLPGTDKTTD